MTIDPTAFPQSVCTGMGCRPSGRVSADRRDPLSALQPERRDTRDVNRSWQPSRLIADAARFRSRPSCLKVRPATRPREISSRSIKLSDPGLRDRANGAKPPFAETIPKTEAACLPKARPISLRVSPCLPTPPEFRLLLLRQARATSSYHRGSLKNISNRRCCADRLNPPPLSSGCHAPH